MTCDQCAVQMIARQATLEDPYKYDLGGGFQLLGITIFRCPQCKAEAPLIPKITQLHALMARMLAEKPSQLIGTEVRFLRKHAGLPAKDLADLLGVTPSHLSRVEADKDKLGSSADRLVRLLGTNQGGTRDALERLLAEAKKVRQERSERARRAFRLGRGGWKPIAA